MRIAYLRVSPLFAGGLLASSIQAQIVQRVSITSGGAQGNGENGNFSISLSADVRFVAFDSASSNLVPGDTNGEWDVFVRDRISGTTERISVDSAESQGNDGSYTASISPDGRFVAFDSSATNLVPDDGNGGFADVFVRDRLNGTTELVSFGPGQVPGNHHSSRPAISADGRFVAFESYASNLVPGDSNASTDIFMHDRQTGATERVSVSTAGGEGDADSWGFSISADGRYVAFQSLASNFVATDGDFSNDVFVRDRFAGTTEIVSSGPGGVHGDSVSPAISADGRYVAFASGLSVLVPGDTNGEKDVFVFDRQLGSFERASLHSSGAQGNGVSDVPNISANGRVVAFTSLATNLVPNDTNGQLDAFVHDLDTGTTERMSVDSAGTEGNGHNFLATISASGRHVVFESRASNLVPGDTNGAGDVFIHDRNAAGFTSVCDPGLEGVISCPCGNPPSGPGRGCDNSAGTGGAILSASGVAYLSMDSLVFTTSGERPTALSILSQWTGGSSTGNVYGMGVRCTSGVFKRMYTKSAVGGGITAPDFGAGDPTVSARSAALGDTILPGQSRWHFVFYRDPVVLGGCPPTSTFNSTQTASVSWSL